MNEKKHRINFSYPGPPTSRYSTDDLERIGITWGLKSRLLRKLLDDVVELAIETGKPQALIALLLTTNTKVHDLKEQIDGEPG